MTIIIAKVVLVLVAYYSALMTHAKAMKDSYSCIAWMIFSLSCGLLAAFLK